MPPTEVTLANSMSSVRGLLRAEGLSVAALALLLYTLGGHSWLLFAILFLVPDVSFLGYLAGPRWGSLAYNSVHTYVAPLALAIILILLDESVAVPLIWTAHVAFDRSLGYGLKLPTGFADTHLGPIGRAKSEWSR